MDGVVVLLLVIFYGFCLVKLVDKDFEFVSGWFILYYVGIFG